MGGICCRLDGIGGIGSGIYSGVHGPGGRLSAATAGDKDVAKAK